MNDAKIISEYGSVCRDAEKMGLKITISRYDHDMFLVEYPLWDCFTPFGHTQMSSIDEIRGFMRGYEYRGKNIPAPKKKRRKKKND